MIEVSMSRNLSAPAEQVWNTIGKFDALADWHPAVTEVQLEDGGKTRRLKLMGGQELVERLVEDGEGSYTYQVVEGPLPVSDCTATIRVEPAEQGSKLTWSAKFEPVGDPMAARSAVEGVYQAGLDNVSKLFQ